GVEIEHAVDHAEAIGSAHAEIVADPGLDKADHVPALRQQGVTIGLRHRGGALRADLTGEQSGNQGRKAALAGHGVVSAVARRRKMAEGQGFEPWVPAKVRRFSKPVLSTAQPSLRSRGWILAEMADSGYP